MPKINPERLMRDLRYLRTIGAVENGVVRPALSETDMIARRWLRDEFAGLGLEATIDGVGNVIGRSRNNGPALLIGSHSDTQPRGGWLDGALGVIYALEIARACAEDPETADLAIDVVSWQDEESNFLSCLGSRSWARTLDPEVEAAAVGRDGTPLAEAIRAAGLAEAPRAAFEEGRYVGYLEAHIEQGANLEVDGDLIGVVTAIVGIRGVRFRFRGQQNHAGTTTMARRRDAATALFELAHRINQEFAKIADPATVWTIGRVDIQPGAASIVPGYAEMDLQFRDQNPEILDGFERIVADLVAELNARGVVEIEAEPARAPIPPSIMDDGLQAHIAASAARHAPDKWRHMPSAAGHDPMILVERMPCAMLFIPSIEGISHDFAEDSHESDIVLGCQVLADAAASILMEARAK